MVFPKNCLSNHVGPIEAEEFLIRPRCPVGGNYIIIYRYTHLGSLWRITKNILKIKDQPFHLKKADGTLAFSDVDKANTTEIFTENQKKDS